MEKLNVEFKTRFMLGSLRNVGYEPYNALDEFVDNSIDANSKNVFINLKKGDNGKLECITIGDVGDGMTMEQLKEALAFGSDSGKTNKTIGMYGTGMKTASMALGRRLRILTKSSESKDVYLANFDIDELYNDEDATPQVEFDTLDTKDELYKLFKFNVKGESGTVIVLDKFDQLPTYDLTTFKGTLIAHLRLVYNKFIQNELVNFFVCGDKLTFFDPIGYFNSPMNVQKMDEGEIEDEGIKAKWVAYNIPYNELYCKDKFDDYYGRSEDKCGLYIYRCNRLVGQHLGLGLFSKHSHWHNGFRMELFLDGNADSIFGSTFTKMIFERDKTSIKQSFYDKLYKVANSHANMCANLQKAKTKSDDIDDVTKKQLEDLAHEINENPRLAADLRKKGKNNHSETPKEKSTDPKKQENPNPTKKRDNRWFGGYEFVNEGKTSFMYTYEKREKLYYLIINQDHSWYQVIFSKLDADAKNKIAAWIALSIVAREKVIYSDEGGKTSEVTSDIFAQYDEVLADQVRLKFFGED